MSAAHSRELDVQTFLAADLEQVRSDLDAATVAVLLIDEPQHYLTARAAMGLEEEVRQGSRVPVGLGFAGRIASERRSVAIDRIDSTTVINPICTAAAGIRALAGVRADLRGAPARCPARGPTHRWSSPQPTWSASEKHADLRRTTHHRLARSGGRSRSRGVAGEPSPRRCPGCRDLDLAARYVPSSQQGVGGDWYDVFRRCPVARWASQVGDVMAVATVWPRRP